MESQAESKVSKRCRAGEGRPTLYTPELGYRLADHVAAGLTEHALALQQAGAKDARKPRFRSPAIFTLQYAGEPASASWTEAIENQLTKMLS